MTAHARAITTVTIKTLQTAGLGGLAAAATVAGFGGGVAGADVEEIGPSPTVTSRQASQNSVIRINDYGVARGISQSRLADAGEVSAFGDVRDSVMAVPGGRAGEFRGSYPQGPAMGDW